MKNWALRQLMVWGGLALLAAIILPRLMPRATPVRTDPAVALKAPPPTPAPVARRQSWGSGSQIFPADAQGHVYIDALVNGVPVHFLVDTGATLVSLTEKDAEAAGIDLSRLAFTVHIATANGASEGAPVTLSDVEIGENPIYDVRALVHRNLAVSLLGQSYLTRLHSYIMQNGQLTLEWN